MDNGTVKKILLISPYWREEHRWMISTTKLAELWQRLGYSVVVVCMGSSVNGYRITDNGTNVLKEDVSSTLTIYRKKDVFIPDPWNYGIAFGFSRLVKRIIKDEQPDIIVINKLLFWTSLCAISLRLRGIKVIQLTDALVGMTWWPRGTLTKVAAALYAWTLGWVILLCADRVIFFHPQPVWLVKRLGISKKVEVIPTGIDEKGYGLSAMSPQPTAHSSITVTYIGRLESVKGVDDFLAAVVPLQKQYPQMNIQVVGWYKPDHPLVAEYGNRVLFTGLRKDIPEILAATDIFVLPSYSEGLSNALMEAMASGCACIASEVGGNAYLIQNGVSGLLFPSGDRPALQAHVRRLIDDGAKRKSIGEAARMRIAEMFSWEIVGKRYQQLFDRHLS
jgi:glycosyltransferase involved in cell wall biosynthesis